MTAVICTADNGGVKFNNRRLSRDRELISDILRLSGDAPVYIRPYSEKLFSGYGGAVTVTDDLNGINGGDPICFFEDEIPVHGNFDRMIIYRWNRDYPADTFFDFDAEKEGFALVSSVDLVGFSHPRITREIYERL